MYGWAGPTRHTIDPKTASNEDGGRVARWRVEEADRWYKRNERSRGAHDLSIRWRGIQCQLNFAGDIN